MTKTMGRSAPKMSRARYRGLALGLGAALLAPLALASSAGATANAWDFIGDGAVNGSTSNPAHSWVGAQVWNDNDVYWCTMDAQHGALWEYNRTTFGDYSVRTVQAGSPYVPNMNTSVPNRAADRLHAG